MTITRVYFAVAELAAERLNLLETLAERLAERIWRNRRRCGCLCASKSWMSDLTNWVSRLCAAGRKLVSRQGGGQGTWIEAAVHPLVCFWTPP